jgi:hypothetical protein
MGSAVGVLALLGLGLPAACAGGESLPGEPDGIAPDGDAGTPSDGTTEASPETAGDPGTDPGGDPGAEAPRDDGLDIGIIDARDSGGGSLCDPCDSDDDCGGSGNYCLRNTETGEVFCGQDCSRTGSCPSGFSCVDISTGGTTISQCVPDSGTCGTAAECDPPCGSGEVCRDGRCVAAGDWDAEQQHCVEEINRYRATLGLGPLRRNAALEDCATEGAEEDSRTGEPHGHFIRTGGCGIAYAENEIPGWSLSMYGSVERIIDEGLAMMWAEGPGGGHYEAMRGPYGNVGCGIYLAGDAVWCVQDFN